MKYKLIMVLVLIANSIMAKAESYWEPHFNARTSMVAMHTATAGTNKVLLLGDSNTEAFWWNSVEGCRIINGGFGGAKLEDIASRATYLAQTVRPKIVHIMLGTNDVHSLSITLQQDIATIITAFKAINSKIVIWPIPPFGETFSITGEELANRVTINTMLQNNTGIYWDWWWPLQMEAVTGYALSGTLSADGVHFSPSTQTSRYSRIAVWNTHVGGC